MLPETVKTLRQTGNKLSSVSHVEKCDTKKEDCHAKKCGLTGAAIESDQLLEKCGAGCLIIPESSPEPRD